MRFFWAILFLCLNLSAAETVFYVNTASTSGGDGTTTATAGANRAFATLREAITHNGLDISQPRAIYCVGAAADTENVVQAHWNSVSTTPANYLRIIGDNPTPGVYNTAAYRLEITGANAIYNNQPGHVRIENLQIKLISGSGLTAYRLATQNVGSGRTDNDCRFINCLAWCPDGGNAFYDSDYAQGASPANGRIRRINCVSIGGSFGSANTGVENYNCTVYGAASGFLDPQVIINCGAFGCSVADFNNVGSGGGLSGYNASEDGTHPGSNGRTGMPAFVDAAGGNLHLLSTDTVLRNYGVANPDSGSFTTDVDGETRREPWTIGADDVAVTWAPASTNVITWYGRVGVPGGIPARTTIYASHTSADSAATIQTSIDNCPSNQVVYLAAGTYTLSAALDFKSNTGVTLRGAGPTTILTRSSGNAVIVSDDIGVTGTLAISSGYTKGSSNIIVSSTSGYAVGDLIDMDQTAETGLVYPNTGRRQSFRAKVTALTGTDITFWPPLPWTLKSGFSPQVYRQSQKGAIMCGVEDLKIEGGDTTYHIYLTATDSCWVKNCEFEGFDEAAVVVLNSLHFEYRHNYAHDTTSGDQAGYGIYLWDKSSHCLVEDNIFENIMAGVLQTKTVANAILYNFATNSYHPAFAFQSANYNANHGAHGMMTLWEGNIMSEGWQNDAYHGSTSHQILFRNVAWGIHSSYTGNRKLIDLNRGSYWHTVVGNVLGHDSWTNVSGFTYNMTGTPDYTDEPSIFRFGYPNVGNNSLTEATSLAGMSATYPDENVEDTLTIHANFDTYTDMTVSADDGIRWAANTDRMLPSSLYYPDAPEYFGDLTFPPFNAATPRLASIDDIPAGYRYLTGNDPSEGGGGESGVGDINITELRVGTIQVAP